tara:strand:+ start:155 stop:577 length:423 start_codon:yes stop_codon:yes gene_type:complete
MNSKINFNNKTILPTETDQLESPEKMLQLQTTVKEYLEVNDEIKTLYAALKERRNKKRKLSKQIMSMMTKNNVRQMNVKDGKLTTYKTKRLVPLTKKSITKILTPYFEDSNKAEEVSEYLLHHRYKLEKTNLRRTKFKKK